jgi:hypothetical protein
LVGKNSAIENHPGAIPVISTYRIHHEQIKKVEQSLKAPYRRRLADPCIHQTPGMAMMQVIRPEPENTVPIQRQKSYANDRNNVPGAKGMKRDLRQDPPNVPPPPVPAMRCLRCKTRMPEIDYLYTKKTGLCITCWEELEA